MTVSLRKRYYLIDIIRGRCSWKSYIEHRDDLSPAYREELKRKYGIA
jgi:hypothetical protein